MSAGRYQALEGRRSSRFIVFPPWSEFGLARLDRAGTCGRHVPCAAGAYSGQSGCTVQLQHTGGTTTAGMFGVTATKPMSLMGEFGPENTSLTAAATDPSVPSYFCGRAGPPASAPGTVMGPSVPALLAAMKPCPTRLQRQSAFVVHEPPPCMQCPLPAGLHGGIPEVHVQMPESPFMSANEPVAPDVVG